MITSNANLAELLRRAVGEAGEVAKAEVDVYKQAAMLRVTRARGGLILIGAAVVLALSAVTALLVGFVIGLVPLVGGVAAGVIVAGVTFAIAYVLVRMGLPRLSPVPAHDVQKAAEIVR